MFIFLFREHIEPYLYENGKVKEVPIKLLVEKRNMVRKAKAMTNEDSKKSFLTRQDSSFSSIFTFKSTLCFVVSINNNGYE